MKTSDKIADRPLEIEELSNAFSETRRTRWSWLAFLRSPLWFCLLVALVARVWLVLHTHGLIDADEALEGVQAQQILHGEFPIYYYGQPYMGSLEAYLIAGVLAIAGTSSVWALRTVPILLSLALVCFTWLLAGALADAAKLPAIPRRWFKTAAALLAALPPLYDMVIELRTWGGHIEIYILMLWLLYAVLRLTQRWGAGASVREVAWRWAGIGFIVGVGIWIYPLIVSAIAACGCWILGCFVLWIWQSTRPSVVALIPVRVHIGNLLLAVGAVPACVLGFAPGIYWGMQNKWANILYLLAPGSDGANNPAVLLHYPTRLAMMGGTVSLYERCLVPEIFGGALPSEPMTSSSLFSFWIITAVMVSCLLVTSLLLLASLRWQNDILATVQRLATLPLMFALGTVFIFLCSDVVGGSLLAPCTRDGVGRYAAPILLALPFFVAALSTAAAFYVHKRRVQQHLSAALTNERGGRRRSGSFSARWGLQLLTLGLVVYVGIVGNTYVKSNPDFVFQSFACSWAPANDQPVIDYLEREHIHYAWSTIALGNPILFKTDSSIVVAQPTSLTGGLNRLPQNALAVFYADRASVIDLVKSSDTYPALLQKLDSLGVTYKVARFPTQPGNMEVIVVTPLSRTLTPSEAMPLGATALMC